MKRVIYTMCIVAVCFLAQEAHAGVISMPPNNLGLVGYWSFNEGSGTVAGDYSGNGNSGAITGATWASGKLGGALNFSGSSSDVNAGDVNDLAFETGEAFSISVWVKPDATDFGTPRILHKRSGSNGYILSPSNGAVRLLLGNGSSFQTTTSNVTLEAGRWYHVVARWDGSSTSNIFIDGVSTSAGVASALTASGANFQIGTEGGSNSWSGDIDEVRIYNRALSVSEIQSLYRSGSARIGASTAGQLTDGLVGHWTFDGQDISGTTVYDRSGQGNDGTLGSGLVPVFGKIGQAYANQGTEDLINIPNVDIFGATGKASLAFWMKNDGSQVAGARYWFGGAAGANRFRIYQGSNINSTLTFLLGDFAEAKSISINPNTWHHIVVNRDADAGTVVVYRDGVQANDWVFTPANGAAGMTFFTLGSAYISGSLDDVRIYNRVLSADEAQQLYRLGQTTVAKTSQSSAQQPNLIGHWTFDGPTVSGTAISDVSGQGIDATAEGDSGPTYGKIGQGYNMDGTSSKIITDTPLSSSPTSITWGAWIRSTSVATEQVTLGTEGQSAAYMRIWSSRPHVSIRVGGIQRSLHASAVDWTLNNGQWYHFMATYDSISGVLNMYINGEIAHTRTDAPGDLQFGNGVVNIGFWRASDPRRFIGDIDDVRIYDTALSGQEIRQLYQMGR